MTEKDVNSMPPLDVETSTLAIHQAVMRETADPSEAYDPGPRWFYYFAIVALMIGGFYLGRHMGEFGTATHIGYLPAGMPSSTHAAAGQQANAQVSGASIFNGKCSSCHQADGKGLPGVFPPLDGSPYVLGDPVITARIILKGLQGAVEVEGKTYNGVMPAWADQLKDAEIAAVISHIRGNIGSNKAPPVDEATVAQVRQQTANRTTPWTAAELKVGEGKP